MFSDFDFILLFVFYGYITWECNVLFEMTFITSEKKHLFNIFQNKPGSPVTRQLWSHQSLPADVTGSSYFGNSAHAQIEEGKGQKYHQTTGETLENQRLSAAHVY